MPGRLIPTFIIIFWLFFFSCAFYEQWLQIGKSVVTAERLYSTETTLKPRVERFLFNDVEKARVYTFFNQDNVETTIRFSVTIDKSVTPSNSVIRANGSLLYNTFHQFSHANFEWGLADKSRGFIAIPDNKGKLKLEPFGQNMFKKKYVDFDKDQIFSIDPTMSVAVPKLIVGESWTFNSYLNVFTKLVDQPIDGFFDDDIILIANAVKYEAITFGERQMIRNAMRVEVYTFTTPKIHVFTSWVTTEGLVLRSEIKIKDYNLVKELVLNEHGE